MLPYLFKIGPVKIAGYGTMLALAFIVSIWLLSREMKSNGLPAELAERLGLAALFGGVVGAKIYFLLENMEGVLRNPIEMIFSGSGLTWYGGLFGGIIVILWILKEYKGKRLKILDLMAPLLLLGYAIGRIGCLLAGDGDYGSPSNLPWAMAFPNGIVPTTVTVHPTPIYETLFSLLLFMALWKKRKAIQTQGIILSMSLFAFGLERFFMEFWRLTPKIYWGWMSLAQLTSLILMAAGSILLLYFYRRHKMPFSI